MTAWASKLASSAASPTNAKKKLHSQPPHQPQPQHRPQSKRNNDRSAKLATPPPTSKSPVPSASSSSLAPFNSTEVQEYLHRNFQKHLANTSTLTDTVLYKSLESDTQWRTKTVPSTKRAGKYSPRAVIRLEHKHNSLDLLFELSRSIYHQQQQQHQLQSPQHKPPHQSPAPAPKLQKQKSHQHIYRNAAPE